MFRKLRKSLREAGLSRAKRPRRKFRPSMGQSLTEARGSAAPVRGPRSNSMRRLGPCRPKAQPLQASQCRPQLSGGPLRYRRVR